MSVAQFNLDLAKFSKKTQLNLDVVARKVGFEIWNGVTKKTPVDTGRARASWNLTEEVINLSTASENVNHGASAKGKVGRITGKGDVIYITNNVDYINELDKGTSQQAPNGMVSLTINEVTAQLNALVGK